MEVTLHLLLVQHDVEVSVAFASDSRSIEIHSQ